MPLDTTRFPQDILRHIASLEQIAVGEEQLLVTRLKRAFADAIACDAETEEHARTVRLRAVGKAARELSLTIRESGSALMCTTALPLLRAVQSTADVAEERAASTSQPSLLVSLHTDRLQLSGDSAADVG